MVVQITLKFLHADIILYIHELCELCYRTIPWADAAQGRAPPCKKQPRPPNSPQSEQKCIHRSQMDLSMVSEQTKLWKESTGKLFNYFLGELEITSYGYTEENDLTVLRLSLFILCSLNNTITSWSCEEFKANSCYKNKKYTKVINLKLLPSTGLPTCMSIGHHKILTK